MNSEKVVFAFFIVLALTVNFGFFVGDLDNPEHHDVFELYAAVVVNLVATVLKFGDRTRLGAFLLAASLVADVHLIVAALAWGVSLYVYETGNTPGVISTVVSLSGGALIANIVSVALLIAEAVTLRR